MGIYDREYYRQEPAGIFLGGPRRMVTNLVIINVAVFLVDKLFNLELYQQFGLRPDLAERPWMFFQLITYGFLHDTASIWHLVMNMLGLWFFGRDVEDLHGPKRFLSFYLTGIIISGVVWLLTENAFFLKEQLYPLVGASGAVCAVLVVFVIHYPMRTLYFMMIPVPAWLLAVIYIGGDLLSFRDSVQVGAQSDNVARSAHLAGAAYGALFWKTRWSFLSLLPARFSLKKISLRPRPKLRVHEPSWENEGDFQGRMDDILAKIKQEGMASLTADEQQFMEEASRRLQKKRR